MGAAAVCPLIRPEYLRPVKAEVPQNIHPRHANGSGAQGAVVGFVGGAGAGVDRVGRAEDVIGVVRCVGVHRAPGVVEGVVGQNVVTFPVCALPFDPVAAVVPVAGLAVCQMGYFHNCAGLGGSGRAGNFVIGADFAPVIGESDAVLRLRVIGVRHPGAGRAVLGNYRTAPADLRELPAGIRQVIYVAGGVGDGFQPVIAAVPEGRHGNGAAAVVFLDDFADPVAGSVGVAVAGGGTVAMGVMNLYFVVVGICNRGQKSIDKIHFVIFVVADFIAAGLVFVNFQPKTVLVIVVAVIFTGVFGKVVNGTVSVGILKIGCLFVAFRVVLQFFLYNLLHDIELRTGADMHPQAKPAAHIIIGFAETRGIAAVVDQIQRYRIHSGSIGYQIFAKGQLAAEVGNIRRPGVSYPKPLVAVIRLQPVHIPVGNEEEQPMIAGIAVKLCRCRLAGAVIFRAAHPNPHRTGFFTAVIPLGHRACEIP